MTAIQDLIDEYIETRLDYDEKHEVSVAADKAHKGAKAKLVAGMVEARERGKKIDYGLDFYLSDQFSIKCNKDNEEDVKEWLHEHYGDVHEFTEEKLVKKTVEEKLKTDIEGEELDQFDVPDFFDLKTRPDVSCRGWKKYSTARRSE